MKINIDDIEKLTVSRLGIEYWNNIFMNVTHNINQIIKNDLSDRYLKYPIDINFYLNQDIPNDPNAYVNKISDKKYNIYIGKKLLILINHYSYKIIDDNMLFNDFDRNEANAKLLSTFSSIIFYLWMDFVCLHEWFHIARGHLEYHNKPYYEYNILSEHNNEDIFFEVDADRFAMKLVTKRFMSSIKNIKLFVKNKDDKYIIDNFITAMIYLFDLFFLLKGENKRSSHPSPLERINIIIPSIVEAMHNQQMLTISEEELVKLLNQKITVFILRHGKEYNINPEKYAVDMKNLIEGYFTFFHNNNIVKHQILK